MSLDPLKSLGVWRGMELAFEGALPYGIVGFAFWKIKGLMSSPSVGKPMTDLELAVILGSLSVLVAWVFARQLYHLGRRDPRNIAVMGAVLSIGAVFGMSKWAPSGFEKTCEKKLSGAMVEQTAFINEAGDSEPESRPVCQIGGIPGNPYAPGVVIRPTWDGNIPLWMWGFMAFSSAVASVGVRDKRISPSKMVVKLYDLLKLAPASGTKGALGEKPKEGRVQACANATFWGEICGQLYSADREFLPGEWCGRCNQTYHRAERQLTFRVVTLFTDNIDVLNGLERTDTVSWDWGRPMDIDARVSGVERWVLLGSVTVPDVISVSQLLSIIHEQLPLWKGKEERTQIAVQIAEERASRLYGWIWFGRQTRRLTYARPTSKVTMAVGTTRLRDIVTDSGEELYFQLDVGLLPLELRVAFVKTFRRRDEEEQAKRAVIQNSKLDLWVPVAPKLPKDKAGLWVPRVEGQALRTWLSTDRLRPPERMEGVAVPLAYRRYQKPPSTEADAPVVVGADGEEITDTGAGSISPGGGSPFDSPYDAPEANIEAAPAEVEPEEAPEAPREIPRLPTEGTLDFIRLPLNEEATDPVEVKKGQQNLAGLYISEWEWLEPEQIQLLRQESLVLDERTRH